MPFDPFELALAAELWPSAVCPCGHHFAYHTTRTSLACQAPGCDCPVYLGPDLKEDDPYAPS